MKIYYVSFETFGVEITKKIDAESQEEAIRLATKNYPWPCEIKHVSFRFSEPSCIEECGTRREVENFIRRINGHVNLSGIDLESAKHIAAKFIDLHSKFPEFFKIDCIGIDRENLVKTYSDKDERTVLAYCAAQKDGFSNIMFCKKPFENWNDLDRRMRNGSGYHPAGVGADSIITHEFCHAICNYINHIRRIYIGVVKQIEDTIYEDVMKKCCEHDGYCEKDANLIYTYQNVSGYASYDPGEFVAEAFSEYVDSESPRPIAVEVGTRMKYLMEMTLAFLKYRNTDRRR